MPHTLLTGLRVIEWGEVYSAPFAGKLLADLGAEVIKIESLPAGDPGRGMPPFADEKPGADRSLLFAYLNAGKRGVALDLAAEAGWSLLRALIGEADVFLTDRSPRAREVMGLSWEVVHRAAPAVVMTSITPYGASGPYRNLPGYPSVSFHASGAGHSNPFHVPTPAHPPLSLPGRPAGMTGGLIGAAGTVMAVLSRKLTGEGRFVDVSEVEATFAMLADPINRYNFERRDEPRAGRVKGTAPFDNYRVKDGYVSIFLIQEAHWQRFLAMMGNPEWAKAEQFVDRRRRAQYREDLDALMEPWLLKQEAEDLYIRAQAADIPIGAARTMDKVAQDPQLRYREFFRPAMHPAFGAMTYLAPPFKVAGDAWALPAPAPRIGGHTAHVLKTLLGFSRRELAALVVEGVI